MQRLPFQSQGRVEAAFQPLGNLLHSRAVAHLRKQDGELIAAQPRQQVVGAKLPLHAPSHLLQVEISDVMTVDVVHLLELIQIDVDQPEDAGIAPSVLDMRVQARLQRKAIVYIGEQVELRAVQQVVVELAGFDGERG